MWTAGALCYAGGSLGERCTWHYTWQYGRWLRDMQEGWQYSGCSWVDQGALVCHGLQYGRDKRRYSQGWWLAKLGADSIRSCRKSRTGAAAAAFSCAGRWQLRKLLVEHLPVPLVQSSTAGSPASTLLVQMAVQLGRTPIRQGQVAVWVGQQFLQLWHPPVRMGQHPQQVLRSAVDRGS